MNDMHNLYPTAKTIKEIKERLKRDGYEGLCCPDAECGCDFDDFNACGEGFGECYPAYRHETEVRWVEYIMSTEKDLTKEEVNSMAERV